MRIGEVNPSNYAEYQKLLGSKGIQSSSVKPGSVLKKTVDPRDFIEPGMDITGTTIADRKIVSVSDEIKDKMVSLARSEFINNYGMTDGEELSSIIKQYVKGVSVDKKIDTGYTLNSIFMNEIRLLEDRVRASDPTWQYGQPFDRSIFENVKSNGFDKKI